MFPAPLAHLSSVAFRTPCFATAYEEAAFQHTNATAAQALLNPGPAEAAEVASYLTSMRESLTQDDFLAAPFNMNDPEDVKVFEALTHNKASFLAWREATARTAYHMELNDYEALFAKHRTSLLDLAESLEIPVKPNAISYDALLRNCDAEVSRRERSAPKGAATFVEARMQVATLRESTYLFEGRTTLHSLIVQDAVVFGVGTQIRQALDSVVSTVQKHKCAWCKAILSYIRRAACEAAGAVICRLLCGIMGPLGIIASKFFCGFPLYLTRVFGRWCSQGIEYVQKATRTDVDCLCGFTIPNMNIPATTFKVLGATVFSSSAINISIGQICVTKPGQCSGSSKADQATYDANKKAEDAKKAQLEAEEAARVKKMTLAQKIAYHKKIIAGEIKTNMSAKLVMELLGTATGLGFSAAGSIMRGAKELAKGNVKGAVASVAKDVASHTVKSVAKATAKKATEIVTSTVIHGVATTALGRANEGAGKVVDYASQKAGAAATATVKAVGNTAVKTAATVAKVTGNKEAAANIASKGTAAVNRAANATGSAVRSATKAVGDVAVDTATHVARHAIGEKITSKYSTAAGNKISGTVPDPNKIKPWLDDRTRSEQFKDHVKRAIGFGGAATYTDKATAHDMLPSDVNFH